ncbi:MAG: flagellar filament capping protein FliD [Candidatus Korobacteraceae bacterium]
MSTSSSGLSTVLNNVNNAFSGKTDGIDVASTVAALMQIQDAPLTQLQNQQSGVQTQISTLGTIASQLSQLQTAAEDLSDSFGSLSVKTVSSSDPTLLTATASNSASAGTHAVVVTQMATTSSSYSAPIADPTTLAGTTLTINYGDPNNPGKTDTIALPSTISTLQDVANAINSSAQNTGVTASVMTDATGQRLALMSKSSGAAGNLTVSGAVGFQQGEGGQDALLNIDGIPYDSATNTVTDSSGLTYTIAGADKNTTIQIGVTPDATTAATAVTTFVTDYNAVIQSINAQYTTDSSGNYGPLESDAALRTLQSQMLDLAGYSVGGTGQYVNLQSLGVEMQDDGTLQLNTDTLQTALVNNYSDFQNFFQSTTGYGQAIGKMLTQITDPTQGTVSLDVAGLQSENTDLGNQITDMQDRMNTVQQQLTTQYSELNVLLQQYPSEIANINSTLASLDPSSSNG